MWKVQAMSVQYASSWRLKDNWERIFLDGKDKSDA